MTSPKPPKWGRYDQIDGDLLQAEKSRMIMKLTALVRRCAKRIKRGKRLENWYHDVAGKLDKRYRELRCEHVKVVEAMQEKLENISGGRLVVSLDHARRKWREKAKEYKTSRSFWYRCWQDNNKENQKLREEIESCKRCCREGQEVNAKLRKEIDRAVKKATRLWDENQKIHEKLAHHRADDKCCETAYDAGRAESAKRIRELLEDRMELLSDLSKCRTEKNELQEQNDKLREELERFRKDEQARKERWEYDAEFQKESRKQSEND